MLAWSRIFSAALVAAFALTACGGHSSTPSPQPTTASNNGSVPVGNGGSGGGSFTQADFTCPSSDNATAAVRGVTAQKARRLPLRTISGATQPGLIAVTYARTTAQTLGTALSAREQSVGANLVHSVDFPGLGVTTRILAVAPGQEARVEAALRGQSGVRSVGAAGGRRAPLTVTNPYYPNDPYFNGFPNPQPSAPSTYHVPPYDEAATVPSTLR